VIVLDRKQLKEWFSGYAYKQDGFRHYAVLIPIIQVDDELHILYEIRSSTLRNQPGEICFPGGKHELNESYVMTALRETSEELGIPMEDIELVGQLDDVITPFNMYIHVFLGLIPYTVDELAPSADEVKDIFTVPLDYLLECPVERYSSKANIMPPENFPYEKIQPNYEWKVGKYPILFIQFEDLHIWGITAKITANFIETLKDLSSE
jgi:8-oxo-dGTP pyrophosphatase MutT (NUDIX family)